VVSVAGREVEAEHQQDCDHAVYDAAMRDETSQDVGVNRPLPHIQIRWMYGKRSPSCVEPDLAVTASVASWMLARLEIERANSGRDETA